MVSKKMQDQNTGSATQPSSNTNKQVVFMSAVVSKLRDMRILFADDRLDETLLTKRVTQSSLSALVTTLHKLRSKREPRVKLRVVGRLANGSLIEIARSRELSRVETWTTIECMCEQRVSRQRTAASLHVTLLSEIEQRSLPHARMNWQRIVACWQDQKDQICKMSQLYRESLNVPKKVMLPMDMVRAELQRCRALMSGEKTTQCQFALCDRFVERDDSQRDALFRTWWNTETSRLFCVMVRPHPLPSLCAHCLCTFSLGPRFPGLIDRVRELLPGTYGRRRTHYIMKNYTRYARIQTKVWRALCRAVNPSYATQSFIMHRKQSLGQIVHLIVRYSASAFQFHAALRQEPGGDFVCPNAPTSSPDIVSEWQRVLHEVQHRPISTGCVKVHSGTARPLSTIASCDSCLTCGACCSALAEWDFTNSWVVPSFDEPGILLCPHGHRIKPGRWKREGPCTVCSSSMLERLIHLRCLELDPTAHVLSNLHKKTQIDVYLPKFDRYVEIQGAQHGKQLPGGWARIGDAEAREHRAQQRTASSMRWDAVKRLALDEKLIEVWFDDPDPIGTLERALHVLRPERMSAARRTELESEVRKSFLWPQNRLATRHDSRPETTTPSHLP
jgi:hypothetical protein